MGNNRKGFVMKGLKFDKEGSSPSYSWITSISQLPPRPGTDGSKRTIIKKCPVCSTEHTHNNSYCSAECCAKK